MKKSILFFKGIIAMGIYVNAQASMNIVSDHGMLTIYKTQDGKDMTIVSIGQWDEMVAGTKYTADHLPVFYDRKFCMEIADKNKGDCRRGIGFGCSIYACPYVPDPLPNRVDAADRVCAVSVRKIKGSVRIIFDDHVYWQSLQKY